MSTVARAPRPLTRAVPGRALAGVAQGLAALTGLPVLAVRLAFVLLAVARGQDVIDWGNALAVVFVAVAAVMLVVSAALSRAGP